MKKILLGFILMLALVQLFAQENSSCGEAKIKSFQRMQKKTRAGNYANSLMNKYDVHFYFLDIKAERTTTVLSGSTTIGATVTASSLDTFCFELNANLNIDSIIYNNQSIAFSRLANITYAILPIPIPQNTNVSIAIYYGGDASVTGAGAIGDGYSTGTSTSWGNKVTWSLSEPYSAYEWFPCKQFLQDKADSAWVFVTTDTANKVGANGLLEGIDTTLIGNKHRFRWKTHYPIDYYLISIAVAKYIDYTIYAHPSALLNDSIPIVNYIYNNPATLPNFKAKIDSMPMILEYYSDILGLYPFYQEKYGHCMAPFGGGMEHQTMTTIGNLGSFATNAHELMHQWFGDHVTCKTWKDIFINEGFASYGEYLAYEHFRGLPAAQNLMANVHNDVLSDPNACVYFTDTTDVGRIFDNTLTYNKGNAVIHTLRFNLGDSLFFKGLKEFQSNFSFSTASINDLKASMEASSGINLNDYFSQWIYGAGYPIYSAEYFSTGTHLFLKVTHTTSSLLTSLFKTPLEIKCQSLSGDTTIRININANTNNFIIPTSKIITGLSIDPRNWLLNEVNTITKNPDLIPLILNQSVLEDHLKIYPNPSHEFVYISTGISSKIPFIIREIGGRIMLSGSIQDSASIDLRALPKGLYIIEWFANDGKVIRKLLKE